MGNVGNGAGQKDPSARQTMYIGRVRSLGLRLSNVCKLSDLSGPLRHFHFHILFYRGSLADGCTKMALPICGDIDSCASKNFIGLLQELLFHNKMGFGRNLESSHTLFPSHLNDPRKVVVCCKIQPL